MKNPCTFCKCPFINLKVVIAVVILFYYLNTTAQVRVYEGQETIPTYVTGPEIPSPIFYTGRNIQGAAGHFYPYAAQIDLSDSLTNVLWDMVYLENEYLKVTILPALGGKLYSAIDKTNGHELFHRNSTIKPDFIGTLGAWISGGIEWCYPHHHRTTTYLPADYTIKQNSDGSATIWVGETEKSLHLRGIIGITLHPGRSYIDVDYRLNNPNPEMRNFKFWANVAVTADENFRTFFPPSQEIGVFHHNSSFTRWPISHEIYKGTDYTEGVDMTWYKNHPSPVSVFYWEGEEGFIGGYDYLQKAGVLHVGDKYINRTSKLWEWGPGQEGENARRKLTDDGRDYVELMTGSYSNNQPDYSWFAPHTVKEAKNYWYPIRDIEMAKNATLDAAVTLQMRNTKTVFYGFNTTRAFKNAKIILTYDNKPVIEKSINIDPATPFTAIWTSNSDIDEYKLGITLRDEKGTILVSYIPYMAKNPDLPEVFDPVKMAGEIEGVEDLYLTGRFVEQFSHPYRNADDYYFEALRKSPEDYRVNLALGIRRVQQWRYAEAEIYLEKAAKKLRTQYVQPAEGELYYYLGLAQRAQNKYQEAYRNFYQGTFYYEWFSQGHFQLAQMESERGEFTSALNHIEKAYSTNNLDGGILLLYSAILRHLERSDEALAVINKLSEYDPLNFAATYEKDLIQNTSSLAMLQNNMQDIENNYIEIAVNYLNAGLYPEASDLLSSLSGPSSPLTYYYLAYLCGKLKQDEQVKIYLDSARRLSFKYCFPYRRESENVLQYAISVDPADPYPNYLLGNLLYDRRPVESTAAWSIASKYSKSLPMTLRNLAFAAFYHEKKPDIAIDFLKRAIDLDRNNPIWYSELEKYYDFSNGNNRECLEIFEQNIDIVKQDVTAPQSLVKLYNLNSDFDKALELLSSYHFRTWEGGRNIYWQYVDAHVMKAIQLSAKQQFKEALAHLEMALLYPENLEVGKAMHDERNAMIYYHMGMINDKSGNKRKATENYRKSIYSVNSREWPDLLYYQALAYQKTGDNEKAQELFGSLAETAAIDFEKAQKIPGTAIYELSDKRDLVSEGYYLQALYELGNNNKDKARELLEKSLTTYSNNLWARYFMTTL
jgi:tetratricopeptide (TPR) repeat protein